MLLNTYLEHFLFLKSFLYIQLLIYFLFFGYIFKEKKNYLLYLLWTDLTRYFFCQLVVGCWYSWTPADWSSVCHWWNNVFHLGTKFTWKYHSFFYIFKVFFLFICFFLSTELWLCVIYIYLYDHVTIFQFFLHCVICWWKERKFFK